MGIDVVILLGAQNDEQGRLSEMALARADCAIRAHRQRPGSRLLLTGGYGHFNRAREPHAAYLLRHILGQGVCEQDVLGIVESANTVEDAALAWEALASLHVRSICVVTSAVHLPRARLIFERFFDPATLTFVGAPNAVPPDRLRALQEHEAARIEEIHAQGGVIWAGRLTPLGRRVSGKGGEKGRGTHRE